MSLVQNAQLLMLLRNYDQEEMSKEENRIDIIASPPESKESILLRVLTTPKSGSSKIGVAQVKKTEEALEREEIDKIIMFGNEFTQSAKEELFEEGIEFFSEEREILSNLNLKDTYLKIINCVNELCRIQCGHPPESEADCVGYSKEEPACPFCNGEGYIDQHDRRYRCVHCGGTGSMRNHYSCNVRLISDNATFHFKRGWVSLLQGDLLSLLEILQEKGSNTWQAEKVA
jgi:hypothetical protein